MKKWNILSKFLLAAIFLLSQQLQALDIFGRSKSEGGHGVTDGLVVLYTFDQVNGKIISDQSGLGTPLNLVVDGRFNTGSNDDVELNSQIVVDKVSNKNRVLNSINLRKDTLIKSQQTASKIVDACKGSNELTMEAWLKNDRDDQPVAGLSPLKIITLSGASNDGNFFLGYNYDMAAQFLASVRSSQRSLMAGPIDNYQIENHQTVATQDSTDNKILVKDKIQHVVFTKDKSGVLRLYVSGANPSDKPFEKVIPTPRSLPNVDPDGSLDGWNRGFHLAIGNEITYKSDSNYPRVQANEPETTEDRAWRGSIYMLAIYCKAHKPKDILGDAAPGNRFESFKPVKMQVTQAHTKAVQLYKRIVGVGIPVSAPIISGSKDSSNTKGMAQFIQEGNLLEAAKLATEEDNFLNITIKDFAKRMSTREEKVSTNLTDFSATVIGVTRDDISAKKLLSGNFFYMADTSLAAVPSDMVADLLRSNNHFQALEKQNFNLKRVLKKVNGQLLYNGSGVQPHRDPAGILTSRAFMEAHATAGTNRRLVEYVFREFMCVPMEEWSNSSGPDNWVGSDVDRFPGGNHNKFLTNCRGCHSNMDGMRGAFAKYNFSNGFVKYADVMTSVNNPDNENQNSMYQSPAGIAGKMNRNAFEYPCGNQKCRVGQMVSSDDWVNHANLGLNSNRFGWGNAPLSGRGVKKLGEMIASSDEYSRCLTRRAFRAVCKRDTKDQDKKWLKPSQKNFPPTDTN